MFEESLLESSKKERINVLFSKEMVQKYLPHKEPFLFIDAIESIELLEGPTDSKNDKKNEIKNKYLVGGKVVARYFSNPDHPIYKAHFPGNPIMPGAIQIEMMAQCSSFILCKTTKELFEKELEVALLNVEKAQFRNIVYPSMNLRVESICKQVRGSMFYHDCSIWCDGKLMSEATTLALAKLI